MSFAYSMPTLPEDILVLVAEELVRNDTSLVDFALSSCLSLSVCRSLLFETLVFNLQEKNGTEDFKTFVCLLRINPDLGSYTRSLTVFDNAADYTCSLSNSKPHLRRCKYTTQTQATRFTQLQRAWANFAEILDKFTALRCLHISIVQEHLLPSKTLSPGINLVLKSPYIQHVSLRGLKDLSQSVALSLLRAEEVHLAQCTFSRQDIASHSASPARGDPVALKTLCYEPIPEGVLSTDMDLGFCLSSHLNLSSVINFSLPITNLSGVGDARDTLQRIGPKIAYLSVDTSVLRLSSLRSRLCAPFLEDQTDTFPALVIHTPGSCCQERNKAMEMDAFIAMFARLFQEESINADGQFSRMMSKLPLHQTFHQLKQLSLRISFWQHCFETDSNGELHWVGNLLRDMDYETANKLEDIEVTVSVATDDCAENAETLFEMKNYEGWNIWDEVLSRRKWTSLRRFSIIVRTSILCFPETKMDCQQTIQELCHKFPRIDDRGILEINSKFTDG